MKTFTEQELHELYHTHVKKTPEYFYKYYCLPVCPIKAWNYDWQNFDFPRNWCVLDFKEWIEKYSLSNVKHLGYTCATDPELEFLNPTEKTLIEYPPYDLHTIHTQFQAKFDFFVFNQTLEHLYNPYGAVGSIYQTIVPGGYVFTSVPTLNIPHMTPIHFGGFTPMGLATVFLSAGFEIVEIGQWGNFDYIQRLFGTQSWPGYNTLQSNNYVSNEENNVCQCWILARRPMNT